MHNNTFYYLCIFYVESESEIHFCHLEPETLNNLENLKFLDYWGFPAPVVENRSGKSGSRFNRSKKRVANISLIRKIIALSKYQDR